MKQRTSRRGGKLLCLLLIMAALLGIGAVPAQAVSIFTLREHGWYTWYSEGEVSFLSIHYPYGILNRETGEVDTVGHTIDTVEFFQSTARHNGLVFMYATMRNTRVTDMNAFSGSLRNGKGGVANGGQTISFCGDRRYNFFEYENFPVTTHDYRHPYEHWCTRNDIHNYDHNLVVEFSWSTPGYTGYWWCYVRSAVAHSSDPGDVGYHFLDPHHPHWLAGHESTNPHEQDHMKCGADNVHKASDAKTNQVPANTTFTDYLNAA